MGSIAEPTIQLGQNGDPEPSLRDPIYSERQMRIICIGAGASGLIFAYKLQRSFENCSFTIYEKNKEISGTWYENKYPGCVQQLPSVVR